MSDSIQLVERFYRAVYRIRRVEEEIARIYPSDKIQSPVHLSIGQEAIAVAACAAIQPSDVVFGTYRSHALYLAKGGDLRGMVAELYGKFTGCAKGKAGSMHLLDPDVGMMGSSAVVGTTIPQAVGYAMAIRARKESRIVVSFFGDGAVEEGVFHESLNFAQLKRLPVVFVCENNSLAIHSRQHHRQSVGDICALARAHGLPAERIENMDVFRIYDRVHQAAEELRGGASPRFIECLCSRWMEHVGPSEDFGAGYRTRGEVDPWIQRDEMTRVGAMLEATLRRRIETEIEVEVKSAFDFAEQSEFPRPGELYTDMFAEEQASS